MIASLMMLALCFQVITSNAQAEDGISVSPNPSPSNNTAVSNATYADLPPGSVDSYGNASHVTNSSLNPVRDAPYLTNESGNLIYRSSFGTYVLNVSSPGCLSVISADGTTLVKRSYFTVDASHGELALANCTVITANDCLCLIEYDLLDSQHTLPMGRMSLKLDFTENHAPKFTATLLNATFDDASWSIVWIVIPNDSSLFNLPQVSKQPIPIAELVNDQIYAPTNNVTMIVNSDTFELNWSDAKLGALNVIQQASVVSPEYGLKVTFPQKASAIDPTIVATSTDSNPTNMSSQRKLTYYGGYYWLFYNSGNSGSNAICYQTSGDGSVWSSQIQMPESTTPAAGSGFDVASRNGMIVVAWLDSGASHNVYFKNGTILGNKILWSSRVTVYSGGALVQPVSVAVGYDNSFWISYVTTAGNVIVARSTGQTVSFTSMLTAAIYDGYAGPNCLLYALLPYANGNLAFLETSHSTAGTKDAYARTRWFYASYGTWSSAFEYYLGMYRNAGPNFNAKVFSAVASWNGTINILYYGQKNNSTWGIEYACIYPTAILHYRGFPSAWYLSQGDDDPTLCMDANNVLHAFFDVPGTVDYIEHSQKNDNSDTWSVLDSVYYCSSGSVRILGLTSWVNPVGDMALAWAESGSPKPIKFADVPLPFGTAGSPSSSWNRDGLSPYGTYFAMNGHTVSPGSGLVVMTQNEVSISGRGGMNLDVSLIYQQPRYFDPVYGEPYGYKAFPFCNVGGFWSLDLPWMDSNYTYVGDGQRYVIQWGNTGIAKEFDNHNGANFVLRDVTKQGQSFYELITAAGMRYQFNHASPYKLETISNLENYNPASSTLSQPIDCVNLTYTGTSPNYVLSAMTESGMARAISFTYSAGLLQKITRPDGKFITFTFGISDSHGINYLTSVSDVLSRITSYSYKSTRNYCIENVTYPTGAKLTITYTQNNTASTEYKTWLVTSEVLRNGTTTGTPLIRQTNFYYKLVDGQLVFCNIANYNETTKIQGYNEYIFQSALGASVSTTKDATGVQMQRQITWYDSLGQPGRVDTYLGSSAAVNYSTYTGYDDWGNVIFTKNALGNESYCSYANTSSQGAFQGGDLLTRTTQGRIFYDAFDNWNYSSWTVAATAGNVALNATADPPHAPAVKVSRTASSGTSKIYQGFTGQSGDFFIQVSLMPVTSISDYIFVSGSTGNRIYFMAENNSWAYYDTSLHPIGTAYTAGTWYDVGFAIHYTVGTYDIYIDGKLIKSGALMSGTTCALNTITFQAGTTAVYPAALVFDNVRIYKSLTITINGLGSGYLAKLYDSTGTTLSQSKTGSLVMAALPLAAPPASIAIAKIGDYTLTTPMTDVWGGDVYSFSAHFTKTNLTKTTLAYNQAQSQTADDSFPGSYDNNENNPQPWVTDANGALSGNAYHVSPYMSGTHYHGFSDVVIHMTDTGSLSTGHIQYIWLQAGQIPQEIAIAFEEYDMGTHYYGMAYWGGDSQNQDLTYPGRPFSCDVILRVGNVPQVTGQWLELVVPDAVFYGSTGITGIYYLLFGGSARWDFSAMNTQGVNVNGLTSGMTVKMLLDNGNVASKTATSSSVCLDTYSKGINVFPIAATFQIYSGSNLLYTSPRISNIYNNDTFTYSAPLFYPNNVKDSIHNRLVGTFNYQDAAKTVAQQSYVKYDVDGNPVEAKSNLGTSWVYSRAGYDIYGNLLWSCDPTGRMTNYQYTSTDKNTYPTTSTTGQIINNFDWDRSWTLSYTPSQNWSWMFAGYSAAQVYSIPNALQLNFTGAPQGTDYGSKTLSKDYKTNKISMLSIRMYVASYTNINSQGTLDSGIRMRLYDSSGVNYATYTYWLACWSGTTNNRTTTDPNIAIVYGKPILNKWLNPVLYPANNWTIDWSRCNDVKFDIYVNANYAYSNTFKVYYDDLVYSDTADISQHTDNFEGTNGWIPYQIPTQPWLLDQNSTTQSHSATHSVQDSFTGAPAGTDYGTGMMNKTFMVSSISTISIWMYVDQYYHDHADGDSMTSGIILKLYDSAGNNYANYTYWLACWSWSTDNKTAGSYTKVIFGKPPMSTWLNVKLNPSSDWNINWSLCTKIKILLYVSCSYAYGDSFRAYYDDLTFGSNFAMTSYQYDTKNGRVLSVTDVSGYKTSYQYDFLGRLVRTNNTDGSFSNCTIDDTNNKVTSYDALRQKTVSYYDGIGRLMKTVRYGTLTSNYTSICQYYNWLDEPVRVVQYPEGIKTLTTYDYLGRTLTVKNNDSSVRSISYNDLASTVTITDELGHKTVSVYDNLGRLNATQEYNSPSAYNQTLMTYDAVGDLLTVRAANGNVTSMSYDSLGRLTSTTYPDIKSGSTKYSESTTYDLAGRVLNETARNGSVTQSVYDASGRLIRMIGNSDTIRTYYDADGNVILKTNALGSINYYYDISNRLVRMIEKISGTSYWFNFTYDADGNLLTTTYPGSITITNNYDGYARLSAVKCGSTNLIQYTYNHDDSVATKSFNNGNSVMTYTYNNRDWVSRIVAKPTGSNTAFLDLNYTYLANGNVASINSGIGTVGNEAYTYDYLNRLTKAVATTTFGTISYVYDSMGNRQWKNDTTNQQYHYGAYNKLSNDGTYTYVYYPNGEVFYKNTTVTTLNRWEYIYNSFDQLVGVKKSTYSGGAWGNFVTVAQYYYDANGMRVKTVEGTATNITVYQGNNPLYTSTSDGVHSCFIYVRGSLEMRYVSSSVSYAYITDALGSVRYVLDNGVLGSATFHAVTYKPFGGAVTTTGSDRFTYTSEVQDPSSGLEYLGARYYDPSTGRFMSMDPLLGRLSDPQSIDRYVYCFNNPLIYRDRTGHEPTVIFGVIGAIAGAVVGGLWAAANNKDVFAGIASGATAGFVIGLTCGVLAPEVLASYGTVAAVATVGAGGAAGTAAGDLVEHSMTREPLSVGQLIWDSAVGGGISAITFGASNYLGINELLERTYTLIPSIRSAASSSSVEQAESIVNELDSAIMKHFNLETPVLGNIGKESLENLRDEVLTVVTNRLGHLVDPNSWERGPIMFPGH